MFTHLPQLIAAQQTDVFRVAGKEETNVPLPTNGIVAKQDCDASRHRLG